MNYLALQNQDNQTEWLSLEDLKVSHKNLGLSFLTYEAYENEGHEFVEFAELDLSEGSHLFVEFENGNRDQFIIKSYEVEKSSELLSDLKEVGFYAKKSNTTCSIYIELDSELWGCDYIRISDHEANNKKNSVEIDLGSISDTYEFALNLKEAIQYSSLDYIIDYIADEHKHRY